MRARDAQRVLLFNGETFGKKMLSTTDDVDVNEAPRLIAGMLCCAVQCVDGVFSCIPNLDLTKTCHTKKKKNNNFDGN